MFSFGCPTPIISPELSEKLTAPTTEVSDVVMDPSTPRALRANHTQLVNYLSEHAAELFDFALRVTEENFQLSAKAFSLLTIPNDRIFEAILNKENNLMKANAAKAMESKDTIQLNRMAMIIQSCFLQPNLALIEDCEYLIDLVSYMHNRSVYDLLLSMVGCSDAEMKEMKEYLIQHSFISKLFAAIDSLVIDGKLKADSTGDNNALLLTNMFKLVAALKNSELMFNRIGKSELHILLKDISDAPVTLLNSKWNAINTVVDSDEQCQEIADHINELGLLSMIDSGDSFKLYQEHILILLSKVASKIDEVEELLINTNIGTKLSEIVRRNPKHSNVHIAMVNFCKNIKSRTKLSTSVINELFKAVTELIQPSAGVEELSFGWNLTRTIRDLDEDFDTSSVLSADIKSKFDAMDDAFQKPYGGEVPPNDEITSFTPEQLSILLRFLTGSR